MNLENYDNLPEPSGDLDKDFKNLFEIEEDESHVEDTDTTQPGDTENTDEVDETSQEENSDITNTEEDETSTKVDEESDEEVVEDEEEDKLPEDVQNKLKELQKEAKGDEEENPFSELDKDSLPEDIQKNVEKAFNKYQEERRNQSQIRNVVNKDLDTLKELYQSEDPNEIAAKAVEDALALEYDPNYIYNTTADSLKRLKDAGYEDELKELISSLGFELGSKVETQDEIDFTKLGLDPDDEGHKAILSVLNAQQDRINQIDGRFSQQQERERAEREEYLLEQQTQSFYSKVSSDIGLLKQDPKYKEFGKEFWDIVESNTKSDEKHGGLAYNAADELYSLLSSSTKKQKSKKLNRPKGSAKGEIQEQKTEETGKLKLPEDGKLPDDITPYLDQFTSSR